MKILQLKTYPFSELSTKAKTKVIKNWNHNINSINECSYQEIIEQAANIIGVKVVNWSIDIYTKYFELEFDPCYYPEQIKSLTGTRLYKYIHNFIIPQITIAEPNDNDGYIWLRDDYYGDDGAQYIFSKMLDFNPKENKNTTYEMLSFAVIDYIFDMWQTDAQYREFEEYLAEYFNQNEYLFDIESNIINQRLFKEVA
ncbi:MAG: hypothetical protein WC725_04920 [Patescibacteria group bacterium]|jgi:hypothetical protein